ncbi:MAG: response regulator [Bacteriovoracaceae bacterium]|nr:response regulator [Bacteriovoracaceae bacterium]
MNYILVVDDEEDIRDIYEMVLRRAFPLDVVLAASGNEALKILEERGKPQLIISDLRMPDGDGLFLRQSLLDKNYEIPFIICSTDPVHVLKRKFPGIHGYVEKPKIVGPIVELVDSVVSRYEVPPSYVPVRISFLLRLGTVHFDLYMKISESKYVKMINADEVFVQSDAERFYGKGLKHLYVLAEDADHYLTSIEKNLSALSDEEKADSSTMAVISLESIESVERLSRSLGWKEGVVEAAKNTVNLAIKVASTEPNILKLFKYKLNDAHSKYSQHVGLLALLNCGFCHQLGWISDSAQMKMGLAAIMHDITVDESVYENIELWNEAAYNSTDKSPEVLKYRNHPAEAVNLLLGIKNVPSDVDQIILQHHELKDGRGFPRGLVSSRISPYATLFIIVEDLINFLGDSHDFDVTIDLFIRHRDERYNSGNFKKVFEVLKENVAKSRAKDGRY